MNPFDWLCLMQHYGAPTRLLDWSESILFALYFSVCDIQDQDGALYVLNPPALNMTALNGYSGPTTGTYLPESFPVCLRSLQAPCRHLDELLTHRDLDKPDVVDLPSPAERDAIRQHIASSSSHPSLSRERAHQLLCTPIAVHPYRITDRIRAQLGTFTIHGGKHYHITRSDLEQIPAPITLETLPEREAFLRKYLVPARNKSALVEELAILGVGAQVLFPELHKECEYLAKSWTFA